MEVALSITAITAYIVGSIPSVAMALYTTPLAYLVIFFPLILIKLLIKKKEHSFLLFVNLILNLFKTFVMLFVLLASGGIDLGKNGMGIFKILLLLKRLLRIQNTD